MIEEESARADQRKAVYHRTWTRKQGAWNARGWEETSERQVPNQAHRTKYARSSAGSYYKSGSVSSRLGPSSASHGTPYPGPVENRAPRRSRTASGTPHHRCPVCDRQRPFVGQSSRVLHDLRVAILLFRSMDENKQP